MRIAHVITSLRTGGAEHLMVDLLPRLKEAGNEVDLIVLNGVRTTYFDQLSTAGINIIPLGNNVYNPLHILKLIRLIGVYDIVHAHNYASQLFCAIASVFHKCKMITTEHCTTNKRRTNFFLRILDKWMYRQFNHIIAISDGACNALRDHLNDSKFQISIVTNGIDLSSFLHAQPSADALTAKGSGVILVMVGNLRPQKDQDTIIKALPKLPCNIKLWLVGTGPRESELQQLVSEQQLSDRVKFWGVRADVPNILKACDIFVMSSHFEGFGLSAVEGMASGLPVIASDVQGLSDVVRNAGLLFPEGNDQQLADLINELNVDRSYYEIIRNQCMSRAQEYDISCMVEGYINVYNNTMSQNG